MIKVTEELVVFSKIEIHFKVNINEKEVWVSRYSEQDSELAFSEAEIEIIKGKELLTEKEQEEVIEEIENL